MRMDWEGNATLQATKYHQQATVYFLNKMVATQQLIIDGYQRTVVGYRSLTMMMMMMTSDFLYFDLCVFVYFNSCFLIVLKMGGYDGDFLFDLTNDDSFCLVLTTMTMTTNK